MMNKTNRMKFGGLLCVALLLMVIGGKPATAYCDGEKAFAAEPLSAFFIKKTVPGVDIVVKKVRGILRQTIWRQTAVER